MGNRIEITGVSGEVYVSEQRPIEDGGDSLLGTRTEVDAPSDIQTEEKGEE